MEGAGVFYDGQSTRPRTVRVLLSVDSVILSNEGNKTFAVWPLESVRLIERGTRDAPGLFTDATTPDVRLAIDDITLCAAVAARVPRQRQELSLVTRILTGTGIGVVALIAAAILVPPFTAFLGRMIAPETERAVGHYIAQNIVRAPRCIEPQGQAALDALAQRLAPKIQLAHPLTVQVREFEMLNAFAAPGGHIVLLHGVIKGAVSPDEVAAVLAHEIAHVAHRDPADQMVRVAGLSLLAEVFGNGGVLAFFGLGFSYSREIERRADRMGITLLTEAGIPLRGMQTFFSRVAQEESKLAPLLRGYLSTHPLTEERIASVRSASVSDPHAQATPSLTPAEWQALKGICSQTAPSTSR